MKTNRSIVLAVTLSALTLSPVVSAAGRGAGGSSRGQTVRTPTPANPDCSPSQDGSGRSRTAPANPTRTPKRDGTGGSNKPANPAGPQDGSGAPPRG